MKILFFGKLGEMIGREVEVAVADGSTVAELRRQLARNYPDAGSELCSLGIRACVADEIVGEQFEIPVAAEVAFFPPLSGG